MKPEEWLDQQIDLLTQERRPATPPDDESAELLAVVIAGKRLGPQAVPSLEFMGRACNQAVSKIPGRPSRFLRSRLARYVALAAVAASLMVGITFLPPFQSRRMAYAMQQAVANLTTYHAVVEYRWEQVRDPAKTKVTQEEFWVQGDRYFWERADSEVGTRQVISDGEREWVVWPDRKSALHGYPMAAALREWSPAALARKVIDQPFVIEGEEMIGGRRALRVVVSPRDQSSYRVWIDKELKLPLQYKDSGVNVVGLRYTITYTLFEVDPKIDPARFTYQPPADYRVTESAPLVPTMDEAARIAGFQPPVPKEAPLRILADAEGISLDLGDVLILYAKDEPDYELDPMTITGWSGTFPVFFHGVGLLEWYQDGLWVAVTGASESDRAIQLARQILPDLSLPFAFDTDQSFMPQAQKQVQLDVSRAYAMEQERAKDPALHAERATPQAVALQFLREQGAGVDAADLTEAGNVTIETVFDVKSGPIRRVYLRQVARNDGHGLWWVVGYDPR